MLNQIGRRLTEELPSGARRHRLLLMLDEFPALGRLDFFESAGVHGRLWPEILPHRAVAQSDRESLRADNAILDNCHVRVSFATNDEKTGERVSKALGTATEMRAMKNYAGHRLSPWLGHLMVSRSETARQLLTQGEVMQLPPDEEIVMVSGVQPIRAKKAATTPIPVSPRGSCRRPIRPHRHLGKSVPTTGRGSPLRPIPPRSRQSSGARRMPPTAGCAASPSFPIMSPS
jgi:type IV secretion system protein VirD4